MSDAGVGAAVILGDVPAVGDVVGSLTLCGRLIDPAAGFDGPAEVVVRDGVVASVTRIAAGSGPDDGEAGGIVIAPGFVDLRAHLREPGNEDAETVATAQAAAAHGGFTTIVAAADTDPAPDEPGVVERVRAAAAASGSPVRVLAWGALTAGRHGETLAALGELGDAGVVGFGDAPASVRSPALFRNALLYAGALGLPVAETPDDPGYGAGAEAHEGYVAAVLGLRGAPAAAEAGATARAIAILADVVRDEPRARLHLAGVSTSAALAHVRAAKAAGLPVTCDVTPHHLALSDEWVAGARRWAWEALDEAGRARDPWADGALVAGPYAVATRVAPPLRSPEDAAACLAALADGTVDAVATDHGPRTEVDTHVEYGEALPGIAGLETAWSVLYAAVVAGKLSGARAVVALTTGPARVLGARLSEPPAVREGAPADLVVLDLGATWTVDDAALRTRARNTPLLGRELPGVVRLTIAAGRVAHRG